MLTILWLLAPSFTLVIFLIIAAYHFGKEDCQLISFDEVLYKNLDELYVKRLMKDYKPNKKLEAILYLIKGSIVIIAPLSLHFDDTINIFQDLNSLFMIFYAPKLNISNTKKILIHTKVRKTKKKKLKAENI